MYELQWQNFTVESYSSREATETTSYQPALSITGTINFLRPKSTLMSNKSPLHTDAWKSGGAWSNGNVPYLYPASMRTVVTEVFRNLPQSFQANVGTVL
jgi:hypothetical protein